MIKLPFVSILEPSVIAAGAHDLEFSKVIVRWEITLERTGQNGLKITPHLQEVDGWIKTQNDELKWETVFLNTEDWDVEFTPMLDADLIEIDIININTNKNKIEIS